MTGALQFADSWHRMCLRAVASTGSATQILTHQHLPATGGGMLPGALPSRPSWTAPGPRPRAVGAAVRKPWMSMSTVRAKGIQERH